MKKILLTSTLIGIFTFFSLAMSAGIVISNTNTSGSFPLVSNNVSASVVVDNNDMEVVKIVAEAFCNDVKLLTGIKPVIKTAVDNAPVVIVGTLGKSTLIDQLASSGKINKSRIEGKWETFCIAVVDNPVSGVDKALVIAGSDPRGTAFGIFELSRKMGVSPWVWWADVIPETHDAIYVSGDEAFGPPSVKYRGMFINDEDFGMKPWAAKNMDPTIRNGSGDIGPRAHEKIFELMLRTKSNFFWPAMHACTKAFWYYNNAQANNPEVARKYQIVLGSSHCEPMLRDNEDEWRQNFKTEYPGVTQGEWNWKTNSAVITKYWEDRVKESKNNPAIYTLGMRGVHDSQMLGYNNDDERAVALKGIIATQRNLLETYLEKPKATVPQLFCPYKEALSHYNKGIDLPVDVTLLWPDDNHGYIRQLSTPTEQARSGGSGVYYHFSYWGNPQDYLWLASSSPAWISYEMSKAYQLNAKDIWVFNVGDIKPAEFEYQFAMDLAWDVDAWTPEKAHTYTLAWAKEHFGNDLAQEIAEIKNQYYHLTASGRPDQIHRVAFSVEETEKRLIAYAELDNKAKALESRIPNRLKDAYFQLITYPVRCAAAMNEKILGARLSFEYASQGKVTEALQITDRAKVGYKVIRELTNQYNKVMANGKWNGMMDYSPKDLGVFFEPNVATEEIINGDVIPLKTSDKTTVIPVKNFSAKTGAGVTLLEGLGVGGASVTVWPLNMTQYTSANITSAPNVEYKISLKKGANKIGLKCLPTFPLYEGYDLRYAVSVDGNIPQFISIKTSAETGDWNGNVLRGYAIDNIAIQSNTDREASLKIYFADPGLTLSSIEITTEESDLLSGKMVNPDFEYQSAGVLNDGTTFRGDPYGWSRTGTLKGNSWGINKDAANYHGMNVCWYGSTPMPASFELSQVIKGLPAGEYVVRCLLGVPKEALTNQRLFANKNVEYYGKESDYVSNLTSGEVNTFAGYTEDNSNGSNITLKEMAVKVVISTGEDLKVGLRTSNKKGDGTSVTDENTGWFKVDYFRLECVREYTVDNLKTQLGELLEEAQHLYGSRREGTGGGEYPSTACSAFNSIIQSSQATHQNSSSTLTQLIDAFKKLESGVKTFKKSVIPYTAYIVNPSFEYKSAGVLNDGTTFRGDPYGWSRTGTLKGESWGINSDATNKEGNNVCWYSSSPLPNNFELYQVIKGLPAGEYTVRCRMGVSSNNVVGTQRLFANNDVQYYGYESNFSYNFTDNENRTFACLDGTSTFYLQEMEVNTVIKNGEDLKLGIRTSNKKLDGTSDNSGNTGWFKVDYFRLELKELRGETSINMIEENLFKIIGEKESCQIIMGKPFSSANVRIISLSGYTVYNSAIKDVNTRITLPTGLYIVVVSIDGKTQTGKILVK